MAGAGIETRFDGYDQVINALDKASRPQMYDIANNGGQELEDIARRSFDAGKDPETGETWQPLKDGSPAHLHHRGTLQHSITHQAFSDGSVLIGSDLVYAGIHQEGGKTKAHIIRARHAKALAFMGSGGMVFRKSVQHPGSVIPRRRFLGMPRGWLEEFFQEAEIHELLGLGDE
jgi:phage gpG-like protein